MKNPSSKRYDLVVIGGGPGGYVAAIRAAQLGLSTAVVEETHLGGICLNWGCIPTKALLRTAEVYRQISHAAEYGIEVAGVSFDVAAVVARSRKVAGRLSKGVEFLLKRNKVEMIKGRGRLAGRSDGGRTVVVMSIDGADLAEISAGHVILATGARPRVLPGIIPNGQQIWTYREAMVPDHIPRRLAIIGSGAIGVEFACFYRAMGAEVTVLEAANRILPQEDAEIADMACKEMKADGIVFHAGAKVQSVNVRDNGAVLAYESGDGKPVDPLFVDRVIVAAGIVGNVEDIGLEGTAIKVERSHIVTHAGGRTDEPDVYAIGDVAGPPWLAHKASHEGVHAAEVIAGKAEPHTTDANRVPGCTYGFPQIASVGITEQQAKDKGLAVRIGRFPFAGNGKALAQGEGKGMIKTIFDRETGAILGVHMVGSEVTELIHSYVLAMGSELTEADIFQAIYPHPTISESLHESALAAYERALHV